MQMDLHQARHILGQRLTRDPSLIFDVMGQSVPTAPPAPPVPGQPLWCVCKRCREMATLVENKCCNQPPHWCVSIIPHMEALVLQGGHCAWQGGFGMTFKILGKTSDSFAMQHINSLLHGSVGL